MKDFIFTLILISIIAYLPMSKADTLVSCSHPELCRLGQVIFNENHIKAFQFKPLVKIVGDPHEYQPTTAEIKDLIKADILITGPLDLNPWIKKVNYQRSKLSQLKTINLPMDKNDYALYPHATQEALSHFWLYPKIFCSMKNRLEEQFIAQNMLIVTPTKKTCLSEEQKIESMLSSALSKSKLPVVLTHDALLPLLESLSKNTTSVVAIKGSGHHQEATASSVKKLYDALKAPKVIWIEELGINVPQNVLAKKRPQDLTIKIDTANSNGFEYFQILRELSEKLQALNP